MGPDHYPGWSAATKNGRICSSNLSSHFVFDLDRGQYVYLIYPGWPSSWDEWPAPLDDDDWFRDWLDLATVPSRFDRQTADYHRERDEVTDREDHLVWQTSFGTATLDTTIAARHRVEGIINCLSSLHQGELACENQVVDLP